MKKNILIILAGILVFMSSCSKDFLAKNEKNPNSPSVVDPKLVLPAALNAISTTMNNPRRFEFVYLWHGLWSISAGYSQPQVLTQYKLINASYQNAFIEFYRAGKNLDVIEQQSKADPKNVYYQAIAMIMKAYVFQNLVDCWGDVPYTEAFQTEAGNLKPVYDKQQAIYEDLVVKIDAAIALIQAAPFDANVPTGGSDIIYGGNMSKWLKFANTLKLRILVHQADMDGRTAYITGKIATTSAIGYIGAGNGALLNPGFLISQGKMNPFYETFYNNAGTSQSDATTYYFAGKDAVDFMKAVADPRIAKFYQTWDGTSYDGNFFGLSQDALVAQAKTSKLGYFKSAAGVEDATTLIGTGSKPTPILTDFESLFVQAEAAQRGLLAGDAQAFYEGAVTQSFLYMGLTSAAAGSYLSQASAKTNYANATPENKREVILTQKWLALNGIAPVEIWTDYRRTGFPSFIHFSTDNAKLGTGTPPVRLLYPQDEVNVNNANVPAGIDSFTSKIFWQKR